MLCVYWPDLGYEARVEVNEQDKSVRFDILAATDPVKLIISGCIGIDGCGTLSPTDNLRVCGYEGLFKLQQGLLRVWKQAQACLLNLAPKADGT